MAKSTKASRTASSASRSAPRKTPTTATSRKGTQSSAGSTTSKRAAGRKKTGPASSDTSVLAGVNSPLSPSPTTSSGASAKPPSSDKLSALQAEMASRVLSRRRLLPFVKRMNAQYKAGWVHEDICRRLEQFSDDVAAGKSPRLMLLMPPRHGKSELASRSFPPWHMGRHPDHEFIACSYNLSLAMGFSRKVKQIIEDPAYQGVFPNTRLDPNNQSTEEWGLDGHRGVYTAAGIGGPITGKGAHVLVIDDPVKNAEEADSADTREKIWEWYLSTAYSRLAPGGGVLIIQTWWHDDDLAGKLQQMMAAGSDDEHVDQFEVVKYPAIAEADEWLNESTGEIIRVEHSDDTVVSRGEDGEAVEVQDGALRAYARAHRQGTDTTNLKFLRCKGQALHPERYDLAKLLRIKAQNRGGRWWSALYQQNPVPDDGGFFTKDQFRRAELPSLKRSNVYIAWDFAISEKKQNDYTVGTVALQDYDDVLHVADQVRFKSGDAFFIVESILNLCSRWYSPSLVLGFEDGQIYRAIEALLKKRMRERRIYPSIVVLKPITDKLARARAIQGRMQQGMVSFSDKAEWFDSLRLEMLRFPAGVHDDQVDSLAWVAQMVVNREPPRKPAEQRTKSWKDKLSSSAGSVSHMAA